MPALFNDRQYVIQYIRNHYSKFPVEIWNFRKVKLVTGMLIKKVRINTEFENKAVLPTSLTEEVYTISLALCII